MHNKKYLYGLVLSLFVSMVIAAQLPKVALIKMTQDVIKVMRAYPPKRYGYSRVSRVISSYVDILTFTKYVVGRKPWRQASVSDRNKFIAQLRTALVIEYAESLNDLQGVDVIYKETPIATGARSSKVNMYVPQADGSHLRIIVYFHKVGSRWKIIDLGFNGISLLKQYQSKYLADIASGGLRSVIKK